MDTEIKNVVKSEIRKTHDNYDLSEKIIDIGRDTCGAIQPHLPRAHNALNRGDVASAQKHLFKAVEVERTQYLKRKNMGKPELNDCVRLSSILDEAIKKDAMLVQQQQQQQQQRTKQSGTQIKVTYHPNPAKRKPRLHAVTVKQKNVGKKDAELVQQSTKRLTVSINLHIIIVL